MKTYSQDELQSILDLHRKWLYNEEGGERANLRGANLCGANLRGANLLGANLCDANLLVANLRGANLCDANLCDAKDVSEVTAARTLIVPEEGAFIGWKKAKSESGLCIVKLEITADAQRSNATGRKCRCSKARVLEIKTMSGESVESAYSDWRSDFIYKVGETVEVDDFDPNRWEECAAGIHFFITRAEAEDYTL